MADEELEQEDPKKKKWVNPKTQNPEWVNPNKQQQQPQQSRGEWQNPKWTSRRERMDRRLERAGLLNYQTQGLSQEEITRRYAAAGISINGGSQWYKDNYGAEAPEVLTDRKKMFEYQPLARQGQMPSGLFPTLEPQIKRVLPSGGTADRPVNYAQLNNGLLVKVPKPTAPTLNANSPYAEGLFATVDQAQKGEVNWTDVSSFEREQKLKDPNFYKSGEITKYPAWMQQQILADPNFNWDAMPKIKTPFGDFNPQKFYYDLSSSPAGMGAAQGALMGALGGPVGGVAGAAAGGVLGAWAAASGYDATKEWNEQDSLTAGAFGLMNFLAEQGEKAIGMGFQIANAAVDPTKGVKDVLNRESWDAGAGFLEVITPAWIEAVNEGKGEIGADDLLKAVPAVWVLTKIGDVIAHPEKYKGEEVYLGAESPMQLDQSWVERIDAARQEIKDGRNYREVMMDLQTGVVAQLGDMAGQAAADPLNFLPDMSTKIVGKVAEATGNKVAATALNQSEGFGEAARRYKNLVQTGQALTIDPNFKVDQMGRFSRFIAGINEQGQVKTGSLLPTSKGLLDPTTSNKTGFIEDMATQTPHSRAQTGAGMFYDNVSAMLQMFDDPAQAGKYLKALANNDTNTWAELGSRFAESPEFYTVLPAIKDFSTGKLDGVIQSWEITAGNRDMLTRIADVMGEGAGSVLEDLAKHGTAEQDFARVVKKLNESDSPQARALLEEVKAGRFTSETLKQMVDVFTGDGALPWHPGQWKAMMLDTLGDHFDQWVTKRLMLDKSPEAVSAFYRTTALMKQAQSILLLGGSPGYAITNGLSNMVHRAVSGLYGMMTPGQINGFMDRFGITPARFDEGVGIGGVVEQGGKSKVKTSAMDKAVQGKGMLTRAKDALGKISKGMPFSKVSSLFEASEGRQAFTIGMKDFWSQSWRRGVGFSKMTGEMEAAIRAMGQDPNVIYAAIESGMNQAEIEKAVLGRQQEVQARSLIHDAAAKTGMSASDAAQMLEKIGVLDTLDAFLKGQTTKDGISQAFRRAERAAQEWIDMRTGDDLKATAESVKQRVGLEGAAAALDVSMKAHAAYTDVWMDHYYRFGEVMNDLYTLPDRAQMDKAIDLAYEQSDTEFRRVVARNAANYKGIFDAWGMSGDPKALRMLEGMGEVGEAMGGAYRGMRENFRQWAGDLTNPARWDELDAVRAQNDRLFKQAFKAKHDAEVKQGAALSEVYESLYGAAAGEAARKWWEDMTAFNDEMEKKEQAFRGEMNQARRSGVPAELIAEQKQKYYSETKILQIAELERINGEGIARLERVIKKGREGGEQAGPVQTPPSGPSNVEGMQVEPTVSAETNLTPDPSPTSGEGRNAAVDEVNALLSASEQRKGREKVEAEARKAAVWDVAEDYWGKGGNYSRGILQDSFALLNALRKEEYGGIPDLTWLDDPRLTPELVRQVLETRKTIKESNAAAAATKAYVNQPVAKQGRKFDVSQINEDTTILRAIALHGGIDLSLAKDLTGEAKPKSAPGVFTRKGATKGYGIDEMARLLADDGYPIDVNAPDFGVQQATDLINRARAGDKVYPVGHDYTVEIDAMERAWADEMNEVDQMFPPGSVFDEALWQTEFDNAVQVADLGKVYEMIGNFPEDQLSVISEQYGVTWRDYLSRVADDVAVRATEEATAEAVAGHAARAEESIRVAEDHAEAVTKRTVLMESLAEAFNLSDEQAKAYGDLSDAVAGWYARQTGETPDEFYNRYFGEVRKADGTEGGGLMQKGQQYGLWGAGQDTPLFSGTAQRVQLEEFKPVAEVVVQESLFDAPAQETIPAKAEGTAKTRTTKQPSGLQDFGEKLGGARKDMAKQQFVERNLSDADLKKMTLSEIWAKSEVDAIEDPSLASMATALRSAIPAKPKSGWKLDRWVAQVKTIRELVQLTGEKGVDYVLDRMRASSSLRPFADKVNLMQEFPRESWSRIGEVIYAPDNYMYKDGQKISKPWASADIDGKRVYAESWNGLVEETKKRLNVEKDAAAMSFEVRRSGKEYFVNKKGDPLYRKLKTFTSSEEAFNFIRQSRDELVTAWDGVKESDNVKETDVRRAENRPRTGKDQREGRDATPEMFLDTFGFRGVEFGNWVSQGGNIRERQGMLNAAYDALRDLSDVLGVPPKALSLDGELGLGMGSRGSGSASAHYEPSYVVINLTKTRGAGTLAHEWFHALDNYFQKKRGYAGNDTHGGAYITYQPETRYRNAKTGETVSVDRFTKLNERRALRTPEDWAKVEGVRPEVEQSFADLVKALNESPMKQRAELIDKGQSGGYWSRVIERGARSFENYVIEKMAQMGYENDYLANVARLEEFNRNPERFPYLKPEEVAPVVDAFDKLFGTIKTRETAKGVELYQTNPDAIPGTFDKGMVTFEDMKGTITAFERGDFSTVVHESGHIYRRMLADVAERTENPYILRDLKTVEEWAGVKDGTWDRAAEEKFARGFEKYLADGKAPTPALVRAFEQFKNWMLDIYKTITGSAIDVKLTDDVRRVFDRMLGAENMRIDLDNQLKQLKYDPRFWYVDGTGAILKRPEFNLEVDAESAKAAVEAMDIEGMQARAAALRERMTRGEVQPGPDADSLEFWQQTGRLEDRPAGSSYREGWKSWASFEEPPVKVEQVRALKDWTKGKMQEGRRQKADPTPNPSPNGGAQFGEGSVNQLFQSEQPFGRYDEASQFRAESEGLDEGWREKVRPLLNAMEQEAVQKTLTPRPLPEGEGAVRDTSPEGQAMLRKYMRQVQNEMATTKLATVRHAERQRDFALLNYSKRYGFDRTADSILPYQFYPTRSMFTWAGRALDKPALYSNYARLRMQQERYEKDVPERLRGKIRIPAPWLPEWAGDGLYIDPFRNLFFPENVIRYLERAQQTKTYQQIEAERVLQEWQADGTYSDAEILAAAQNQTGKVWERAQEEAALRRENENANPMDFFTGFFGPAWYLSTPLNLAGVKVPGISTGDPNKVGTTPLGNTSRALDTVTDGTWAEPVGDIFGLIGKAEDWGREKFNLPTHGEYAEYYAKKQVAVMVAEGLISPEEGHLAMVEQSGPIWTQATERVDMELALRVPLAGVTYAALHDGLKGAAQAALPSMFGASLLPKGELEFRGLKQEWDEAWKLADAGDTNAVSNFYDEYPEYKAWLAKNKDNDELLKSFLVNQIKDAYYAEEKTNRNEIIAELGDYFTQSFLDKETRDPLSVDLNQLVQWAQMLNKKVPAVEQTTKTLETPASPLKLYPKQVTDITDQFFTQRTEKFPNYWEEQGGYYDKATKAEKRKYLLEHPNLKAYWDWKNTWYDAYPQYEHIFDGKAFKRVDTSGWMPGLEDIVRESAYTGGQLPSGARAALMNIWLMEGQPMENFDTWVKSVVLPGMMYGGE